MTDGAWADGVRDMLPAVTYPNHTTLITGVAPAMHGIAGNLTFDPLRKNMEGWYWYAEDVKVPSLFDAVHAKGGVTLGFCWPATAGSLSITDNLPEYWRTYNAEDVKVVRVATQGLAGRIDKVPGTSFTATCKRHWRRPGADGRRRHHRRRPSPVQRRAYLQPGRDRA